MKFEERMNYLNSLNRSFNELATKYYHKIQEKDLDIEYFRKDIEKLMQDLEKEKFENQNQRYFRVKGEDKVVEQ